MIKLAQGFICVNRGIVNLYVEILCVKTVWVFQMIEGWSAHCIVGVNFMKDRGISRYFCEDWLLSEMRILIKSNHYKFLLIYRKLVFMRVRILNLKSLWSCLVKFFLISRGSFMLFGMRLIRVVTRCGWNTVYVIPG